MTFVTNGHLNVAENKFEVTVNKNAPTNVAYRSRRRKSGSSNDKVRFDYNVFSRYDLKMQKKKKKKKNDYPNFLVLP